MDGLTLDQFAVFVAIVDEGSFSAAAKRLNRAQSALTYAIQKLEQQSGDTMLFDRSGYRPMLTAAGHVLLPTARAVLEGVARYRARAEDIHRGLESEVRIVADLLAPLSRLFTIFGEFEANFPQVSLRLSTDFHDKVAKIASEKQADLAIMGEIPAKLLGLNHYLFDEIEFVVVAAPGHVLARCPFPLEPYALATHLQLVIDSRHNLLGSREFGVVSEHRWYLADLGNKLDLLTAGIGWGSMPRHTVAAQLADGRLIELPVTRWDGSDRMPRMAIAVSHHPDRPPGPAGRWLIKALCGTPTLDHGNGRPARCGVPINSTTEGMVAIS